ncbi:protein TANC1-like isoform X1 [Arapaima gigas]
MFKAVLKKTRDGGKGSRKDSGFEFYGHSAPRRGLPGGPVHPQDPFPHEDQFRPSLTKGASMSLPSSPLLPPRQSYVAPQRSVKKSPGPVRKPKYAENPRVPGETLISTLKNVAQPSEPSHHEPRPLREPSSIPSPATQELMTRLGFLLGDGIPAAAGVPMEDRNEKKCTAPSQGVSPCSTLTSSTASPNTDSPCSTLSSRASRPVTCGVVPSPSSTLESKDSGIIATVTSSSENEDRSGSSLEWRKEGGIRHGPSQRVLRAEVCSPVAEEEPLPGPAPCPTPAGRHLPPTRPPQAAPSLGMQRPNSVAATSSTKLEDLSFLDDQRNKPLRTSIRLPWHGAGGRLPQDSKGRLAPYKPADIMLKPLLFEVPGASADSIFVGRSWLFRRLEEALGMCVQPAGQLSGASSEGRGAVVAGGVGSGKTAVVSRLVALSCHGGRMWQVPSGSPGAPPTGSNSSMDKSLIQPSQTTLSSSRQQGSSCPGTPELQKCREEAAKRLASKLNWTSVYYC